MPRSPKTLDIEGLCCASEVRQIEPRLGRLPDLAGLDFDIYRGGDLI